MFLILFFVLQKILHLILLPISAVIYSKKGPRNVSTKIPPITNNLLLLPAIDLAKKIKQQEISSEEVVLLYIERICEVNPIVNGMSEQCFSTALDQAKKVDKKLMRYGQGNFFDNYPLLGVPFTVKECYGVSNMRQTAGSLDRRNDRAEEDAEVVELLRQAGAIPICTTNVPEWLLSYECYNHMVGRTLNPYDLSRTCGGSSGGEAALLATGASLIGIGSDSGGSIRLPALFCGVFGHKATPMSVSERGHFPVSSRRTAKIRSCYGPMTRYAKDLAPMLHIMSNENPKLQLTIPVLIDNIKVILILRNISN